MGRVGHILFQIARVVAGVALLCAALSMPVYFFGADISVLDAAGKFKDSPSKVVRAYLDTSKPSAAMFLASATGLSDETFSEAEKSFKNNPSMRVAGGKEPFFEAFYSTLNIPQSAMKPSCFYEVLALAEHRKKLYEFLSQSDYEIVRRIIALREMNPSVFPPVASAAGAPLSSAILTSALLIQSGFASPALVRSVSDCVSSAEDSDTEPFERFGMALLSFSKRLDWIELGLLVSQFDSVESLYDFAMVVQVSPSEEDARALIAYTLLCDNPSAAADYLRGRPAKYRKAFSYALSRGEGALDLLFNLDMPLYRDSAFSRLLKRAGLPLFGGALDAACARNPHVFLILKTLLCVLAGYLILRGIFNLIVPKRDTPKWFSTLSLLRGFFEGSLFAIIIFAFLEPVMFKADIDPKAAQAPVFSLSKIVNSVKDEGMKFEMDSTTTMVLAIFFLLQFIIYVIGLIRISSIKRSGVSSKVKLDLLNNESDLFDMGLYVGLWGTVLSLVMLSLGIVEASLMTAYMSTLFGILFTAILKIVNVRSFRRKLIIECSRQDTAPARPHLDS